MKAEFFSTGRLSNTASRCAIQKSKGYCAISFKMILLKFAKIGEI